MKWEAALFGLALLVYLGTRLAGLERFPIYFFCDEAAQTVLAADLVESGFFGGEGDFLPTFFVNGSHYRLGFTVYLHILPYLLFGKAVLVTRLAAVLFTLPAAAALGLALRDIYRVSAPWAGVLFLSITPTWFLHSRTAFEYPAAVTLWALSLGFYLFYRLRSPRCLYPALIAGALAFYSYSAMQMVVLVTGALLGLSDLRYHLQHRAEACRGLLLLGLLALPALRFLAEHPGENGATLQALGSYWVQPLPLFQKLGMFGARLLAGLNPLYWYTPNPPDLARHVMKGYGHLLLPTLPFAVVGLVLALRNLRSPAYRVLLAALVAAPTGAALVEISANRALGLVLPAALLTAIGAAAVLDWLAKRIGRITNLADPPAAPLGWNQDPLRGKRPSGDWSALPDANRGPAKVKRTASPLYAALFILLVLTNLYMTRDALRNGPTWFQDYGLYGMQWGAQPVFGEVRRALEREPQRPVIISPVWTNGIVNLARFFLPYEAPGVVSGEKAVLFEPLPLYFGSLRMFMEQGYPIEEEYLFVITAQEYQEALAGLGPRPAEAGGQVEVVQIEKTLTYPNGQPGFYFVHLRERKD